MPKRAKHPIILNAAYRVHSRKWQDFLYCYPVISRRSKGLSIGVNLNPDKACNFDCIYCQVDRTVPPTTRTVELPTLAAELSTLLGTAADGSLFAAVPFDSLQTDQRVVRDIAFSGDGEPTTSPQFDRAVQIAAEARKHHGLAEAKIVLITDACYLTRPTVRRGLQIMDENNGEIWAKLDAGTQGYYELVNRPNFPLAHVIENIIDAARVRPVVIQSLWMSIRGEAPPGEEIRQFCERLHQIIAAGGRIKLIQVYTIARRTTEPYAAALPDDTLINIARTVESSVSVPVETYPGVSG
jgi:wyosine [tRNA(Phe)-imidazoG37] synthetase (radical SAM superfamily)